MNQSLPELITEIQHIDNIPLCTDGPTCIAKHEMLEAGMHNSGGVPSHVSSLDARAKLSISIEANINQPLDISGDLLQEAQVSNLEQVVDGQSSKPKKKKG